LEPETNPSLSARISSGLAVLRRIRASVSAFFSWLWSNLRSLLQKIKTSIRNQDNTDDERAKSQNKGLNAVPPKPDSPPAPPKEKHPRKKCRSRLDIARFVVEVLGLIGLVIYAVLTYFMYCETKKAANAADSAAKTAANQLELAERPWVDANIAVGGPLIFNINGASLPLKIALRNTGNSPALAAAAYPLPLIGAQAVNAVAYRGKVCETAEGLGLNNGFSIFPNAHPLEQEIDVGISKEDIESGKASKEFPNSKFGEVILSPAVVVCIAYRPTFNKAKIYHTVYIVDLFRETPDSPRGGVMFKIGEDVPREKLSLRFHISGGVVAE